MLGGEEATCDEYICGGVCALGSVRSYSIVPVPGLVVVVGAAVWVVVPVPWHTASLGSVDGTQSQSSGTISVANA